MSDIKNEKWEVDCGGCRNHCVLVSGVPVSEFRSGESFDHDHTRAAECVKRWNSHNALVDSLEGLLELFGQSYFQVDDCDKADATRAIEAVRKALALANETRK